MRVFFFGVKSPSEKGHYLFAPSKYGAQSVLYNDIKKLACPFFISKIDGGFLPQGKPQQEGEFYLTVEEGWTILSMWDRTGDSRYNSNANFIAEGTHTLEEMQEIAATNFREIWGRIQMLPTL